MTNPTAVKRVECGCQQKKFEYDEIVGFSTSQIMCRYHANEYRKQLNSHED